jgi:hypothetical protein
MNAESLREAMKATQRRLQPAVETPSLPGVAMASVAGLSVTPGTSGIFQGTSFSRVEGTVPLYRSFYSTPDTVAQLQAQSASGSLGDNLRKARNPHTSASPALGHGEPSSLADALRQRQRSPPSRPGQDSRMSLLVTGLLTHSALQWRKT